MTFDLTMISGLTDLPVNKFISPDVSVTWEPNKYDVGTGEEKVENNVDFLNEDVGEQKNFF